MHVVQSMDMEDDVNNEPHVFALGMVDLPSRSITGVVLLWAVSTVRLAKFFKGADSGRPIAAFPRNLLAPR